jgi:hypothetical protein
MDGKQDPAPQDLDQHLPDFTGYAAYTFSQPFSKTPCLERTWNLALSEGNGTYDDTRARFWGHVNAGDTEDAALVARIVALAGYSLGSDGTTLAPTLSEEFVPSWATPGEIHEIKGEHVTSPENSVNLEKKDRKLTVEHYYPKSVYEYLSVDPDNLMFSSARENTFKGTRIPIEGEKGTTWVKS